MSLQPGVFAEDFNLSTRTFYQQAICSLHPKITEKANAIQVQDHIIANNLIPDFQSEYQQNHSTETALLKTKNNLLLKMHKDCITLLVMLDLSAALLTLTTVYFCKGCKIQVWPAGHSFVMV